MFYAAIFLLAGFTQGVSGFGAALVAMPLLSMIMDIQTAVPLYMLNGLVLTLYLSLQLRSHVDLKKIRPLFLGCLPGIYIGLLALKNLHSNLLQISLGCLVTMYALYSLTATPRPRQMARAWAWLAGFLTGAIGSAFSAGGPPTIIYVSLSNWTKDEIKATLSVFFFSTGVLTAIGHALSGLTTGLVLHHFATSLPFTLVGVMAGSLCYKRIKQETYIKIIRWLLVFMGLMMIGAALKFT